MKYVFDPFAKHDLVLGGKTLVGNHRGQMFLVVGHQVCTHLRRDFVPLFLADPLQVNKVSRLTFGNSNLQLPPQIFYGIKVWRLARPLQDLNVLLDGGEGVLGVIGSIPPPPNTASWVDAKELDFGLIWPQNFHPVLLWIIGKLHGVVCYQLFSWWLWSQLPWDHWQILPCSSGLIPHSRWDLAWSPVRGRLTVILHFFYLRIITPTVVTFSPSCLAMVL